MSDEAQDKELAVGMSFTAPLSVAQWLQEYMRRNSIGRSEAIVRAIETLKVSEKEAVAA